MKCTGPFLFLWMVIQLLSVGGIYAKPSFQQLTVEQKTEPLGIDEAKPRFGWTIQTKERAFQQRGWQIQVSSSFDKLKKGVSDLWDSGQVESAQQQFISYDGTPLQSAHAYFWRVRIWDKNGKISAWSEPARFVTGLLTAEDWEGTHWVAYEKLPENLKVMPGVHLNGDHLEEKGLARAVIPLFRKTFAVEKKVTQAFLFISGLGQYEARLNGEKVGDDFLAPGWTNYEKRCLYNTYEVTQQLQQGENVLGAIVGTGFMYINRERYRKMVRAEALPMLRALLWIHYEDGSTDKVASDGTWKTDPSPITFSSIYGGEDYDARKEQTHWDQIGFNDQNWQQVLLTDGPGGELYAQRDYPLRVMQLFDVKERKRLTPHKMLVDFGQNASAIIRLKVKGKPGDRIKIKPAEVLDDAGLPYQAASGGPYYFDYTLKGDGEEVWEPRFTYYGFRYALIETEGIPVSDVELKALHTRNSSPTVGSFTCSNPLFNEINELIKWGIQSNLASVATDCPHREKLGWLEQTHLIGASLKYNFDVYHLYDKIIDDMIEGQLPNGLVPDIVPEYVPFEGGFRDSPEWGSASIIIPWYLYQWYGNKQLLEKAYPMMKRYLDYLGTKADRYMLSHGLGDWFDLGPKDPGVSQLTPIAFTATATYFYDADLMVKIAAALGKNEEAAVYRQLAANIKQAFNDRFYQKETGVYATGSQTAYAMPLYMGLVPEQDRQKVSANLIDSIRKNKYALTAGDVGYRYLLRALEDAGASSMIYQMNNRDDVPGYGFQIKHGATALTESWPALKYVSNNHMMLGHLMEWFYSGLAGIKQQEDDFGFQRILIAPQIVKDLEWVKANYQSINGEIRVHWSKEKNSLRLKLSIPANTTAQVLLPTSDPNTTRLEGKPLLSKADIRLLPRAENEQVLLEMKSGDYVFEIIDP